MGPRRSRRTSSRNVSSYLAGLVRRFGTVASPISNLLALSLLDHGLDNLVLSLCRQDWLFAPRDLFYWMGGVSVGSRQATQKHMVLHHYDNDVSIPPRLKGVGHPRTIYGTITAHHGFGGQDSAGSCSAPLKKRRRPAATGQLTKTYAISLKRLLRLDLRSFGSSETGRSGLAILVPLRRMIDR